MKKYIFILFCVVHSTLIAQKYSSVEYFVDIDPGFGKAIQSTLPVGDSASFIINTSLLTTGLHTMYIRVKDSNGHWSHTVSRLFIKDAEPTTLKPAPTVVSLEYFIDNVGYFGTGKQMSITNPSMTVETDIMADLKDITIGKHSFYVRAKDSNGQWGMTQKVDFEVIDNTALLTLSDNDKIVLFPNPAKDNINIKGLEHKAFLQIFDTNGKLLVAKDYLENESLSLDSFNTGVYLLRISTLEGSIEKRFIKK